MDLGDPTKLVPATQSTLPGACSPRARPRASSRRARLGKAFFSAGTNRRMWRFTTMNYLCRDMEHFRTWPPDGPHPAGREPQPGRRQLGLPQPLHRLPRGMDPMAGAYAYYDWDAAGRTVIYTRPGPAQVPDNAEHLPLRLRTTDDCWENYWRSGPISVLGWRGTERGLRREESRARGGGEPGLLRVPGREGVRVRLLPRRSGRPKIVTAVETDRRSLRDAGTSMKRVLAETAVFCMGK